MVSRDLMKATCAINVYYFPFDIQECYIEVFAWGYTVFEVLLTANTDTIDTASRAEHGSWTIIATKITTVCCLFVVLGLTAL